jgi:hypothetical protein
MGWPLGAEPLVVVSGGRLGLGLLDARLGDRRSGAGRADRTSAPTRWHRGLLSAYLHLHHPRLR